MRQMKVLQLLGLLMLLSVMGCTSTLRPRTSVPLPYKSYKRIAAVMDASRAYPVAFFALPNQAPVTKTLDYGLGGTKVMTGQWLAHLAFNMDQALHEVGLFDQRFRPFAQRMYRHDTSAGDLSYPFKPDANFSQDMLMSGARLAKLSIHSLKPVTMGAERVVQMTIEVSLGGLQRMYQATCSGAEWDAVCFHRIARKLLGDPNFWKSASQTF